MAPDSASDPVAPLPVEAEVFRDKVRLRFRKGGPLRFLSHHDLMRTVERMLRRAGLPVRHSKGFNPRPRLIFALSLPLGVVGCQEVAELELTQLLPLDEIRARLASVAPPGLEIHSIRRIDLKASAQVRCLSYALAIPAERLADLALQIAKILAARECWVERPRPTHRRVDLRPFLHDLQLLSEEGDGSSSLSSRLEMDLWLTSTGTARPDEVLTLLGLHDLLDAGGVLQRTRLELYDETPPPAARSPEATPPRSENSEGIA
jgi:radical SAM-linked protein